MTDVARRGTPQAVRNPHLMEEAAALAADGELGNSNAIRLLERPHSSEDLLEIIGRFDHLLTPQARGKLTGAAYAPFPAHVENQRYEPLFDRYPLSGRTYTTARGVVTPNEVQYYNGVMVHLYGECPNVAAVRQALAGSGYSPLLLKYADGRETAVAHFWCHNLSDTTLRPYNAMFIIVAAVPDHLAHVHGTLRADANGASSVLSVLDGTYDASRGIYHNRATFLYLRLLDSTQVAIDFGRERMGTDKRPGSIDLTRAGSRVAFDVRDGMGRGVANISVTPTQDAGACEAALVRAAATAGVALPKRPSGTEHVFPGAARIGNGPVVTWDWRSDVTPRLQPVEPGMAQFHTDSEEGALLGQWGFQPRVLGFLSHVRGVVTGVPDVTPSHPRPPRVRIQPPPIDTAMPSRWR